MRALQTSALSLCAIMAGACASTPNYATSSRTAPPAPKLEQVVYEAKPGQLWIEGRFAPDGSKWVWVKGHYVADKPGHVWRDGTWTQRGSQWVWMEGGWEEARAGHVRVRGHWERRGDELVWVAGFWQDERPGHRWEDGHWQRHGDTHIWQLGQWIPYAQRTAGATTTESKSR